MALMDEAAGFGDPALQRADFQSRSGPAASAGPTSIIPYAVIVSGTANDPHPIIMTLRWQFCSPRKRGNWSQNRFPAGTPS
jgi:hypothetical protein